ncbi:hypothetical protein [Pseudosulfitobacter sp. DSM 107133]|uniref:hypothetical protein n=1 Tax=Pseudosulfitobacter sp. DSM 107133 TaxID=2883100 RepID=UPI000DF22D32|nr:hypothetical protein [Pseudosulfitobacter sp. DSM 107133]UOA30221.1 hypothetical protein DSM107133_04985 [Pseudosulfitobacter sp. DSM 107133]
MNKIPDVVAVLELTNAYREKYAKTVFAYEDIKEAIVNAATQGRGYIRVSQTLAANLKETKAAKQLVNQLKLSNFNVEWVDTSLREKSNGQETGAFVQFQELRISWAKVKIHSGPQVETA